MTKPKNAHAVKLGEMSGKRLSPEQRSARGKLASDAAKAKREREAAEMARLRALVQKHGLE